MTEYESKLRRAYDLGRVVGTSEFTEIMADRKDVSRVSEVAQRLFYRLLEEEEGTLTVRLGEPIRVPPGSIKQVDHNFPPDPFDFVATGEMVETDINVASKKTNFFELTKSSESLAEFLSAQPYCGRGEIVGDCNEDCYPCVLKWLNEEATPDD